MTYPSSDRQLDQALVQSLQAKEPPALERLYDTYGTLMYGLAFRILNHRQEAEDLIQDIFLTLWRNCAYDPARGSLRSYLMMMVHSRAIDRLRSRKAHTHTHQRWYVYHHAYWRLEHPMDYAVSTEISQQVQAALRELPDNQRQAIQLAYYEGLSQSEISQRLKVPLGTVKSWFRLSFTKLRRSLDHLI